MLKFAEPSYLYLMLLVPILIVVGILSDLKKKKDLKKFVSTDLLKILMPDVSTLRPKIKFILQILALTLIVIVLAQPQFGSKNKTVKKTGLKIMIALDVSKSMLCEDISPSRMERAKLFVEQIIDNIGDNSLGLVVFAGSPFVQLPITNDYISAKMFLSSIKPGMLDSQGTAIGAAIRLCANSFGAKGMESHAIIVITDGENHEDDAAQAAKFAAEEGVYTSVIGIGTLKGGPIPLAKESQYLKDKKGDIVITKLDEKKARDIAIAGQGIYVRADNTNHALAVLRKELRTLLKTEYEETVAVDKNEQFQSFACFALFFILMDLCILYRKNRRIAKMKFFDIENNE